MDFSKSPTQPVGKTRKDREQCPDLVVENYRVRGLVTVIEENGFVIPNPVFFLLPGGTSTFREFSKHRSDDLRSVTRPVYDGF